MSKPETIPCKYAFSNGSEFEYFIETQCEKCTRFRKGKCRIYNACWDAMGDINKFPYDDLLDYAGAYGGKQCKRFTDQPLTRKRRNRPCAGQLKLEGSE